MNLSPLILELRAEVPILKVPFYPLWDRVSHKIRLSLLFHPIIDRVKDGTQSLVCARRVEVLVQQTMSVA